MPRPQSQVDMAVMNAAIDKVLAYEPPPKSAQTKQRTQRKTGYPPPAKARKNTAKPAVR